MGRFGHALTAIALILGALTLAVAAPAVAQNTYCNAARAFGLG